MNPPATLNYKIVGAHDSGGVLRAIMILECGRACQIPLRQAEARKLDGGGHVWGWDGKEELATVTPSIKCSTCGFHKTLTKGVWA